MGSVSTWMLAIEGKAYLRLQQLRERGLWDGGPPVPVDHVLEHLLELSIAWEEIQEEPGEEILACLRPDTREVVLNEIHTPLFAEKPGLERFSKGHEAGHADVFALLGASDQLKLLADACYRPRRRSATRGPVLVVSERIKSLSPELRTVVMREMIRRDRARQAAGEDSPLERRSVDHYAAVLLMPEDLLRRSVQGRDLTRWPTLYDLADGFQVTISAMVVRLKELGMIYDVIDRQILLRNPDQQDQTELF